MPNMHAALVFNLYLLKNIIDIMSNLKKDDKSVNKEVLVFRIQIFDSFSLYLNIFKSCKECSSSKNF
jgi:hypothetical protein